MKRGLRDHIILCILFLALIASMGITTYPDYLSYAGLSGSHPAYYLVDKAMQHRLVLIGEHHRNQNIHKIILEALPSLVSNAGINTLFVEIPSDQQESIDLFLEGTLTIDSIGIWDIIASNTYSEILLRARELGIKIIAIDKPLLTNMTRDEWMGQQVCQYLDNNSEAKGIIIAGTRHVFKDIKWMNIEEPSLADYLSMYDTFSIIMWPNAIESPLPIAVDISPWLFDGIKDPTLMVMNTMPNVSLATTADGVILLP